MPRRSNSRPRFQPQEFANPDLCEACGDKYCFRSEKAAQVSIDHFINTRPNAERVPVRVYFCPIAVAYHTTSIPAEEWRG